MSKSFMFQLNSFYLPCEVAGNPALQHGFGWNTQDGTDQAEFQQRYLRLVCEWAERYGRLLDGWWFDGCYTWPVFHNRHMRWNDWFAAARAGNSNAAVTFNDGCFCVGNLQPIIPEHDWVSSAVPRRRRCRDFECGGFSRRPSRGANPRTTGTTARRKQRAGGFLWQGLSSVLERDD